MSHTYKSYVGYDALIVNMQAYGRNSEQFVVGVLTSTPVYYVNVSGKKRPIVAMYKMAPTLFH